MQTSLSGLPGYYLTEILYQLTVINAGFGSQISDFCIWIFTFVNILGFLSMLVLEL